MLLSVLSGVLKDKSNPINDKKSRRGQFIYEKLTKITFTLGIVAFFSFSAVGCNTLKALEPTAILIADIAKVL